MRALLLLTGVLLVGEHDDTVQDGANEKRAADKARVGGPGIRAVR